MWNRDSTDDTKMFIVTVEYSGHWTIQTHITTIVHHFRYELHSDKNISIVYTFTSTMLRSVMFCYANTWTPDIYTF